jgi:N-acetylglucosamine-6-phosphate deacetylase
MSLSADLLLSGATIITPDGALGASALATRNGKICYLGSATEGPQSQADFDCDGGFLLPGFVDLHCHGGGGYDASSGLYDPKTESFRDDFETMRAGIDVIARTHLGHGTTTIAPTTCACEENLLLRALKAIGEAAASKNAPCRILGANIEGSYLKDPAFAGAQNPSFFRRPAATDFERLNQAAAGHISIVNVTADWGKPGIELVKHLLENGVVAACGHSGGDYAQMQAMIEAGTSLAVHFSNGPCSTTFKPPGMVNEALLENPHVTLELIADGYHINPRYLLSFLAAKNFRAILITDAMLPVGAEEIQSFTDCGMTGEKSADGGVMCLAGSENTLFGSLLSMDRAVANLVGWLTGGTTGTYQNAPVIDPLPIKEEALVLASRLASGYPAEIIGQQREFGALVPGLAADMVLLNEDLTVKNVWVAGKQITL